MGASVQRIGNSAEVTRAQIRVRCDEEHILGRAQVRQVFPISKLGLIFGSAVTEGKMVRGARVRVKRGETLLGEGTITSLKRFKDDVREVEEGFECGILLEGFNDLKEGDVLEVYETREVERTDLDTAPTAPTTAA
jgi:translation initiation factor IF-2